MTELCGSRTGPTWSGTTRQARGECERNDERHDSGDPASCEVEDQAADSRGEQNHDDKLGEKESVADSHDLLLAMMLKVRAVHKHGRQPKEGRGSGECDQNEVESELVAVEFGEARLECDGEKEPADELDAGQCHPQFLENIAPVAVGALVCRLIAAVIDPCVFACAHGVDASCALFARSST